MANYVCRGTKVISVKELDNDNATSGNVYTIYTNKSVLHVNQQQQTLGKDKYANAQNNNVVAIEFLRRQEREPPASRSLR